MALLRNRLKRRSPYARDARRWWRKGRERAEEIAEHLQEETIPALTHEVSDRVDSLRSEAAPLVKSFSEQVPQRRSRKARAFRLFLGLAAVATVAVVAYIVWQRRDQEPAYLVQEPDEPMSPEASGPGGSPAAQASPNGQPSDAVGRPHRYQPQSTTAN